MCAQLLLICVYWHFTGSICKTLLPSLMRSDRLKIESKRDRQREGEETVVDPLVDILRLLCVKTTVQPSLCLSIERCSSFALLLVQHFASNGLAVYLHSLKTVIWMK